MTDAKTEEKVFKKHEAKETEPSPTVPRIVAAHIAGVMTDRTRMHSMEQALDSYIQSLSESEKAAKKEEIKKQLTDGRLALESLLNRFLSS